MSNYSPCPCPKFLPTTPELVMIIPSRHVVLPFSPHTSCGPPSPREASPVPRACLSLPTSPSRPLVPRPSPLAPLLVVAIPPHVPGAPSHDPLVVPGTPRPCAFAPLPAPCGPSIDPFEVVNNAASMLRRPLPRATTSPPPDPPRLTAMAPQPATLPKIRGQSLSQTPAAFLVSPMNV
jgi:hypothetical protein